MPSNEFQQVTDTFMDWLQEQGVKLSPKAVVVDYREEGRGRGLGEQIWFRPAAMFHGVIQLTVKEALDDFNEDELIFSIPRASVLSIDTCKIERSHLTYPSLGERLKLLPAWLSLTFIIMLEKNAIQSSSWGSYLAVLPRELDALIFWSEEELSELQASAVLSKIGKVEAEEAFHETCSALGLTNLTLQEFHRTASTIMAYAFDIPESDPVDDSQETDEDELVEDLERPTTLSLVPLADLLNADADRNNARLCCENENLEMRSIKPIQKGEEILNDYGTLPRSDLLRRYGYITDRYAQFDVVELSSSLILSTIQAHLATDDSLSSDQALLSTILQERLDFATREGILEDSYDISHADGTEPSIPDELVALIFILLISDNNLQALQQEKLLPSRRKMCNEILGGVLVEILQAREREYATAIEEDEELLRNGVKSGRKIAAIKIRHGEKLILREAIREATSFRGSTERMLIQSRKRGADDELPRSGRRSANIDNK